MKLGERVKIILWLISEATLGLDSYFILLEVWYMLYFIKMYILLKVWKVEKSSNQKSNDI